MRRLLLTLLAIAAFCPQAYGQDSGAVRTPQSSSANSAEGKSQFRQTCGFCHGLDARGGASGPDLIRSTLVSHDVNGDLIGPVVHNGRPDKGMPAFQLSDVEIKQIAAFLHAEADEAASVARKIPSEYPLEKLLVGDAKAGRIYFAAHCATCHTGTKDLSHIASKYKPFDLQTRIAFPSGAKRSLTVKDSSGMIYEGEETYSDEFVVTLRDSDQWLHTWQRKNVEVQVSDPLAEHEKLLQTYTDQNIHDLFAYLESMK